MKATIILLFFSVTQLVVFSQSEFGVKAAFGISKVDAHRNLLNIKSEMKFAPSAQGGFFYELELGKRSVLGAELLFSQMEGKETLIVSYIDGYGNKYEEDGRINIDYHISYLVMPFTYGVKVKKVTFSLGAQVAYEIANGAHEEGYIPMQGTQIHYENDGEMNIDKFDYGARVVVFYELNQRFSLEGNYYYGFNNILATPAPPDWEWRNQQLTIGLRYSFYKKLKVSSAS